MNGAEQVDGIRQVASRSRRGCGSKGDCVSVGRRTFVRNARKMRTDDADALSLACRIARHVRLLSLRRHHA